MSLATVDQAMFRIETARTKSPIAVFKTREPGKVDTIFASTYWSQERIKTDPNLIGVFHRNMDMGEIRWKLNGCVRESEARVIAPVKPTSFSIGAPL